MISDQYKTLCYFGSLNSKIPVFKHGDIVYRFIIKSHKDLIKILNFLTYWGIYDKLPIEVINYVSENNTVYNKPLDDIPKVFRKKIIFIGEVMCDVQRRLSSGSYLMPTYTLSKLEIQKHYPNLIALDNYDDVLQFFIQVLNMFDQETERLYNKRYSGFYTKSHYLRYFMTFLYEIIIRNNNVELFKKLDKSYA